MAVPAEQSNESLVVCDNSQGVPIRATLLRMTRYVVSFEVYNPYSILQLSEVLNSFKIVIDNNTIYSGRAIITSIVNTGLLLVCEASLDEENWLDVDLLSPAVQVDRLASDFERLIDDWLKVERISPEMKIIVSDMQALLRDMRRWLEQVEHSLRSVPPPERQKLEMSIIEKLNALVLPITNQVFQKFEEIGAAIGEDVKAVHRAYARRQLHPFLLASPFIYRTFQKPLGYAGDYEMVNMILRDPNEGASLFAKIINTRFVHGAPAEAHRNRIKYLSNALRQETREKGQAGPRHPHLQPRLRPGEGNPGLPHLRRSLRADHVYPARFQRRDPRVHRQTAQRSQDEAPAADADHHDQALRAPDSQGGPARDRNREKQCL